MRYIDTLAWAAIVIFLHGLLLYTTVAQAQRGSAGDEWRYIGGDMGHSKYSPLSQITKENVSRLEVVWAWTSIDEAIQKAHPNDRMISRATYFECTPLMVEGEKIALEGLNRPQCLSLTRVAD